ncbi:hypothetical protein PN498_07920 [Oscillatoria sp. CS-180]|uniref:hypothetical protein n=1 Tax=Oscillatoria sp. CS-180 TaxID=3021720 RepID=UPI00232DD9B0|nr:hypothetical protein [Oscillatoria sp. CS-180]MDB9525908.1 hypothetical protein [Oscillatoria sp. CS-180]
MAIPFILEIAIGLVFIYLTLSLLASEIQEIIGTLLQWRAEHLKRSIEVLIAANDKESRAAAQTFADRLYDTPILRSLNQEATGPIAHFFRVINQIVGKLYRTVTQTRNVFGNKTSGPSYIPGKTFAQALLDSIQVEDLRKVLLESRLVQFLEEKLLLPLNHMVNDLRASTANEFLLNIEFRELEQSITQLVEDFKEKRATLSETIDRLLDRFDTFADSAQDVLPDNHPLTETFMRRLKYLRNRLASTTLDKAALLKTIQPSLDELVSVLDENSIVYRELKGLAGKDNKTARRIFERMKTQPLPESLKQSLASLAEKAGSSLAAKASDTVLNAVQNLSEEPVANLKIYLSDVESDVKSLGLEIENWFDRGMDRATGVYRRNAKAVSILIGIAIAISLNADSLHILDRLSRDPAVRSAISLAAEEVAASNPDAASLEQLEEQVDQALSGLPIPLGYGDAVVAKQQESQQSWFIPFIPRRVLGWIITGFALSMGANFWFSLLKRVVNVRNTGREEGTDRAVQR